MVILSFAHSISAIETNLASSLDARIAAELARFSSSAPEKPGVPRAIDERSISGDRRIFLCDT